MRLFYSELSFSLNKKVTLSESESKHLCKVLRMKVGDSINLLDGKGGVANCEIIDDHYKKAKLIVQEIKNFENDPYIMHIAIAPTKNTERIEWFVEKATELGVHKITFLICKNNEKNKVKLERLNRIAISAMKQSQRFYKPEISDVVQFSDFLKENQGGYIAHCFNNDEKVSADENSFKTDKENIIVIGPEGDFSVNEIKIAREFNYKPLTLGNTRLRTETAGLYACMLMKQNLE